DDGDGVLAALAELPPDVLLEALPYARRPALETGRLLVAEPGHAVEEPLHVVPRPLPLEEEGRELDELVDRLDRDERRVDRRRRWSGHRGLHGLGAAHGRDPGQG